MGGFTLVDIWDQNYFRELIEDFANSCGKLPQQIIIFRLAVIRSGYKCQLWFCRFIHHSYFKWKKIWNIFSNLRCCFVALLPRDGVSEGQFTQVLNIELAKIIEVNMPPIILSEPGHHILLVFLWSCASEWWWMMQACKFLRDNWYPKFMVIVAQKNHHTRFFEPKGPRDDNVTNVPAGKPRFFR